jgi:hypothetical protein
MTAPMTEGQWDKWWAQEHQLLRELGWKADVYLGLGTPEVSEDYCYYVCESRERTER